MSTSQQFQPKYLIIGIDFVGPEFKSKITTLLFDHIVAANPGQPLQRIQQILLEIYHESAMQVFDCMNPDFQEFSLSLATYPDYSRYISGGFFQNQPVIQNVFRECFLEFAIGIYLAMKEQNVIFPDTIYILDNPALDHLTCTLYPK